MNENITNRIGLGFAIGAFGFMVIGSVLNGSTVMTALTRGVASALIFGGLIWILGYFLFKENDGEGASGSDDS